MQPIELKHRPEGFLDPDKTPPEVFDYVRELHEILWRFVKVQNPEASGDLTRWLPTALFIAENRKLNGL